MLEVYSDKFELGQLEIADRNFVIFFEWKIRENERVARWTLNNLEQVRNTYKRIQVEVGLVKKYATYL